MFEISKPNIAQCKHFVVRKKRFCKMTVKAGEEYCGEHQKSIIVQEIPDEFGKKSKQRIVCPLDQKHTCYFHNLKKHLKICNARQVPSGPHISKGINYSNDSEGDSNEHEDTCRLLSAFTANEIKATIVKVNEVHQRLLSDKITEKILTNDLIEKEMLKPEYGDKTKKHLKQASSILGLLNDYGLIKSQTCYIEFGAGRGQLSYWISKVIEGDEESNVLLIEKASPKHKRDNKICNSNKVKRIRADISDLVLDKVDNLSKAQNIVGVAKHLCGAATDLALRCLINTTDNRAKVKGGVFTFCCHHRCRWTPYTGKSFFKENGLDKNDFDIMCVMASWATCGTGLSRERQNQSTEDYTQQNERDIEIGLNRQEKEEAGRRSKNIINWGRLRYLEKLNFKCRLHYYVNTTTSLENVCLVVFT